jgi:hypothetical protein
VTDERRRRLMQVAMVVDGLVCAGWAYWSLLPMLAMLRDTGSGGIGSFSVGFASPAALELVLTVAAPVISIWLAQLSATRLARWWRNAHLLATLALVIVPMVSFNPYTFFGSLALFLPVQVFFVVGSVAIWFASPRKLPPTEAPA